MLSKLLKINANMVWLGRTYFGCYLSAQKTVKLFI